MSEDWKPSWRSNDLDAAKTNVARLLRARRHAKRLADLQRQFQGSTWWSRQFNQTARQAYSEYETLLRVVDRWAQDAPRVLRIVQDRWSDYLNLVYRARSQAIVDAVIREARRGPAELYFYIITQLLQASWRYGGHAPGMEESSLSAWRNIGQDNQLLWPHREFAETVAPSKVF